MGNKIKAVYFDMGGVLMDVNEEYSRENALKASFSGKAVQNYFGNALEFDEYLDLFNQSILKRKAESPGIQEDAWCVEKEMLEQFAGRSVPFEVLREKFWNQINYMTSCFTVVPEAREALEAIRKKGLIIGLISNVFHPAIIFKELFTKWEIIDYFHPLVFSSEFRFKKPHSAIFNYALSWHPDLLPEEALYVGDTWEIDITGARAVGMNPIWLNTEYKDSHRDSVPVITSVSSVVNFLE